MGAFKMFSSSSYDKKPTVETRIVYAEGNPDPSRFRIDKHEQIGKFLLLCVVYPDCRNYEGKKVLIYEGLNIRQVESFKTLDPHFSNNKEVASPIARFEPTMAGWERAKEFCKLLTNQ